MLIFDLDGTLIDSAKDLTNAINLAFKEFGKREVSVDEVRGYLGNGAEMLITRALSGGKDSFDKEEVDKILPVFKKYYANNVCVETTLYEGVRETLSKLPYKKAIVTNKPYEFVEEILEKLDIKRYFDLWIGGDSLDEKKPSAKPLLYVCEKFNISPQKAVMIGDSKNDIIAAKRAGIKSIALTYGYNYGEDIRGFNPDIVIDDFRKVLEVL